MDRSGSRYWSLHCLQSRIQGSSDRHEESCGRPRKSQGAVHRTQVQGRDGIGKCIVWEVKAFARQTCRLSPKGLHSGSSILEDRTSRSCFSVNKRLISVTSCSIFLGSCSTAACLQSSVQCSLSFITALMPHEFLQTLRTQCLSPYAGIVNDGSLSVTVFTVLNPPGCSWYLFAHYRVSRRH